MLKQGFDQALVFNHFANRNESFMFHDSSFTGVLAHSHKEGHRDVKDLIHLCEHKGNLMLQEGAACFKIFFSECLADGQTRRFSVNLSKSEHSPVSVKQAAVLLIEQYLSQYRHIAVVFIFMIEGRCWVVCDNSELR